MNDLSVGLRQLRKHQVDLLVVPEQVSVADDRPRLRTWRPIGSVRCIISPIDGDCALGFRCVEFTSCSMADEQFLVQSARN